MNARPDDVTDDARPPKAPRIDVSARRIGNAGKATLESARDTGRALRRLISADLALARSAIGRAFAWLAVAIVFGASAWLFTMGVVIAALRALGLSWLLSIAAAMAISLIVTLVAIWRVSVFFEHAGLHATRRQLARLGIGDESDDDEDDNDDDDATETVSDKTEAVIRP